MEVNFLDVIFNLRNESYQPYKKPNEELQYINVLTNHQPQILKQQTTTISDRFSRHSSSELIFNESKHKHEDGLRKSGFKSKFIYKDSTINSRSETKIMKTVPVYQQTSGASNLRNKILT